MKNQTTTAKSNLIKFLINNGLGVAIIAFFMIIGYQYFEMRMNQMETEFNQKINKVGYSLNGYISNPLEPNSKPITIDLLLKEIRLPSN